MCPSLSGLTLSEDGLARCQRMRLQPVRVWSLVEQRDRDKFLMDDVSCPTEITEF